jgi:hypothetical protein
MCRVEFWSTPNFFDDSAPARSPTGMNSRSPAEEAPIVSTTTLRLFLFPPVSTPDPAADMVTPAPVVATPAAAPARATPVAPPVRAASEDAPFSDEILDWMSRGDSLAEPRAAEAMDLGLELGLEAARPTPPPGMRSRRAAVRERRLRRLLTVGALAFAAWAVVLWTTRQSVSVGDRSALAATGEARVVAAPARGLRPINPNAPGAAWAAPAPQAPAPAPPPAVAQDALPEKSPVAPAAHGQSQSRQHSAATPAKHHRRGRR